MAGVDALRPLVVGRSTDELFADMGAFWRTLVGDSQLRWIGPEKGVIHLATAAVVNAVWDLFAKRPGKPALAAARRDDAGRDRRARRLPLHRPTPSRRTRRWRLLERLAPTRAEREAELRRDGYPAYTTSVGWLGYDDDKIRRLCREALADGWTRFKLKVGADVEDDLRRVRIVREEIGPEPDAGGRCQPALGRRRGDRLDGAAGAVRPVLDRGADQPRRHPGPRRDRPGRRARSGSRPASTSTTGSCSSSSSRPSAIGVCQIDACRLGGVNEVLAVLLLAAEVRRPGLPARRRRRPVRARPAPRGLRLRRGQRLARRADDRVRRPPPRALPRPGGHPRRALRPADPARLQRRDAARIARSVPPLRTAPSGGRSPRMARRRPADAGDEAVRPGHPASARIGSRSTSGSTRRPGRPSSPRSVRANIRNYSIYRHDERLFAYFEYVGDDFAADMAAMAADPDVQRLVDAHRRDAGTLPGRDRPATGG